MGNLINYIIFLSGSVFGGIIIYVFKTFIEHELASYRSIETIRTTEFNKAAATFRVTFVDVIFALRQNTEGKMEKMTTKIITNEVLIIQEKAKILFEPSLAISDTKSFNDAWSEYAGCRNSYQKDNNNPDPQIKEESQHCLSHIEALLFYAKPKYTRPK
jgi:hypothetical protein